MEKYKESHIFRKELNSLYSEWIRCKDREIQQEISKDIWLLKQAIQLLS